MVFQCLSNFDRPRSLVQPICNSTHAIETRDPRNQSYVIPFVMHHSAVLCPTMPCYQLGLRPPHPRHLSANEPSNMLHHHSFHNLAGHQRRRQSSGLNRQDGKRPDELSLIPWQSGKPLLWDVTVASTLASLYVDTAATGAMIVRVPRCQKLHVMA